jgi:hypothetical protein
MMGLEAMTLDLHKGESKREICPKCGGGASKERTLSITVDEDGWLLWHCFRASCGAQGRKLLWGVVGQDGGTPKKLPKAFTGALVDIHNTPAGKWLEEKFGILTYKGRCVTEWRYAPECDRIYIPYYGPDGQFRGSLLREWKTPLTPRNLVYKEILDEPFIGWFHEPDNTPPVLVEDAISALKVYQAGLNAISLCGTHLSPTMVREILSKYPRAVIALDKDATAKAVGYAGTFRHLLGLKVWKLEKDLKYEEEERIREAYYGKATDFSRDQIPEGI